MFKVFKKIEEKCRELDEMRIVAQTGEIMHRQKGEWHTADRFQKVEEGLAEAIRILRMSLRD